MSSARVIKPQTVVYRFILLQAIVTLLLAGALWIIKDFQAAYSVIIGGLICIMPNTYFTWRVLRHTGARAAKRFVAALCLSEVMKLFFQGLLFVLAMLYLNIAIGPFLIGFIVNILIFWLAPFIQFGLLDRHR